MRVPPLPQVTRSPFGERPDPPRRVIEVRPCIRGRVRAGIVTIGDELLSGHTQDTNTAWLAKRLHLIGVPLVEVRIVPDDAVRIQGSVWELQERRAVDVVITSGGLGPTHDDHTVAVIAALHGVPLVRHGPTWDWLKRRHQQAHASGERASAEPSAASAKMALVPQGSEVVPNSAGAAPGLVLQRPTASRAGTAWTIVLPGVPQELQTLWSEHLEARLVALAGATLDRRHVRELLYRGYESEAADVIGAVQRKHPGVGLGSYPRWGKKEVVLRVSGVDRDAVERAFSELHVRMEEAGHTVEAVPAPHEASPNA